MDKKTLPRHALAEMPNFPRSSPNPVRVIEMLVYPRVQLLDVSGPLQVFTSANEHMTEAAAQAGTEAGKALPLCNASCGAGGRDGHSLGWPDARR